MYTSSTGVCVCMRAYMHVAEKQIVWYYMKYGINR